MTVINPKAIIEDKILTNISDIEKQSQQNGIDITLKAIDKIWGLMNVLTKTERSHIGRTVVKFDENNRVLLNPWQYDILFNEKINIPNWVCAQIFTRSTLNRWGNFITTWLYDAWYKWVLGWILHINQPLLIEKWVRVAQIVFQVAQKWSMYEGIYNNKATA